MQRGLGGTAFEPVQQSRDRELTLGPFMLTFLGCGLFALCGLCFVFGYAVGHRNAESAPVVSVPGAGGPAATQSATPKPAAGQNGSQAASAEPSDSTEAVPDASAVAPAAATQPAGSADQAPAEQPASSAGSVQPALAAQPAGIMVQIAAVSHPEDADVLVGALRKRGYAVTARRDPTDGLLHVQIGPFANRNDAWAMRQKLLNDGYNAIVQP
jgi:DedD protein